MNSTLAASRQPSVLAQDRAAAGLLGCAERGWLPDALIRYGIRRWCAQRLREEAAGGAEGRAMRMQQRIEQLRASPLAIDTEAANAQHYELPAAFFEQCLDPRLKYSCGYFPHGAETLAQAEEAMLNLSAQRAQLEDGQEILWLGCGWGWLRPDGKLFVHIFAHHSLMYPFAAEGNQNWMGRHFFTGGLMPAVDTLLWFQQHVQLECRWLLDGTHYRCTAEHWLRNMDGRRDAALAALTDVHGDYYAALWAQRWRMFWMACAELFGYGAGQEWLVAHYRFTRASGPSMRPA